jgi:subtilase family serine protease
MRFRSLVVRAYMLVFLALFVFLGSLPAQQVSLARPLIVQRVDEGSLATLKGNTRPEARAAYDRGAVSPNLSMPGMILVLRRSAEQEAALGAYADSLQVQGSPNYHHWLTAAQQGAQFGPAETDIEAITNWLRSQGFSVDSIADNRMAIHFSGSAAQVQKAFHTEIHTLNVNGAAHIANMSDPQIPSALAPAVVGVQALHNFFARPLHHLGGTVQRDSATGKWKRISPFAETPKSTLAAAPDAKTVPEPLFSTAGGDLEDIAPYDFAAIYNVLPLWNASTPIDGRGQTIAIVGTSDINASDVATFRAAFGLPTFGTSGGSTPSLSTIHPDVAPGNCPSGADSCAGDLIENSLDVEWSGAVAKNANIILVASTGSTTVDPVYVGANYVVQHNTAPIVNVSYGLCELGLGTAGNASWNTLWQTASVAGISVFVSTGDSGAPSCDQGGDTNGVPYAAVYGLSVSGLASTPYNVAVGGTDFNWSWNSGDQAKYWNTTNTSGTLANAKGYIPEAPWNSTCTNTLFDSYLNAVLSRTSTPLTYTPTQLCSFIANGQILFGASPGSTAPYFVDTIGGSGGVSGCTTSDGATVASCSGGYAKPSWQTGVTGIPADSKRDIPDVSFFAANGFSGSAYVICATASSNNFGTCSYTAGAEPVGEEVGGTSVSSPAMAGVMALINQQTGSRQGLPNQVLYKLASTQTYSGCSSETVTAGSTNCSFNDIDTGTIAMACVIGSPNCTASTGTGSTSYGILSGYNAGTGYDLVTGLGSLNVANVVNAFAVAVAPVATLSPTSLTFASTLIGTATSAQTATLTNTGTDPLTVTSVAVTGAAASSFTQTNNCTSVTAGNNCTISVIFKPTAPGVLSASISITDNAAGSPQTVTLTGTGVQPGTYSLSAAAVSVTHGSTGTSAITATGTGGYVGPITVTLKSCTLATSPTGATNLPTCTIAAPAVTFGAGSTAGTGGSVTISTTAATSALRTLEKTAPWAGGAGAIAAAGLFLLIPTRKRKWGALLGVFMLFATLGVISGCGGSGSSSGGGTSNPGTTTGTYTFTVTGTDLGGTTQTATVAVTVN